MEAQAMGTSVVYCAGTHGGVNVKLVGVSLLLGHDGRGGDEGSKGDVLDHCVL